MRGDKIYMMKFHKLALLTFSLFAFTHSFQIFSQTTKIKTATLGNGTPVYTEVFEFDFVDEKPQFPGGCASLVQFINATRQYPEEAYQEGVEGRVTCSFIVLQDGKLSNIKVIRGVEPSLNQEAVRIISLMPEWCPGKIHDHAVPVRVVYSIPFRK